MFRLPVPVTARSKTKVCGRSPAETVGSNPTGGMDVCCFVLSGRGLCDELITRPEESYRLWCVVCDLETSRMRRPWPTGGCRAKNKQTKNYVQTASCLFQAIMIVNNKMCDGSTSYLDSHRRVGSTVGNASRFTEFLPVRIPAKETIHLLLLELFRHRICFYLTGIFVYFTAGILNSFKAATIFIVLTDRPPPLPLERLIFQRGPDIIGKIFVDAFRFLLEDSLPDEVIFIYYITNGDFCILFFLGVDTSSPCGSRSNVDFLHFPRQNFERFSLKKSHYTAPF
jgi:hypothetical protein